MNKKKNEKENLQLRNKLKEIGQKNWNKKKTETKQLKYASDGSIRLAALHHLNSFANIKTTQPAWSIYAI